MSSLAVLFSVSAYANVQMFEAETLADMAHGSGESLCKDSMQYMA